MRCRWWFVGAGILLAVAVGFQQAEPLDKLHEFGKVGSGGWWVDGKLHGRRFVAKDSRLPMTAFSTWLSGMISSTMICS